MEEEKEGERIEKKKIETETEMGKRDAVRVDLAPRRATNAIRRYRKSLKKTS